MIRKMVLGALTVACVSLAGGCGESQKAADPKVTGGGKDEGKLKQAVTDAPGGGGAAPGGSTPKKMAPGGAP